VAVKHREIVVDTAEKEMLDQMDTSWYSTFREGDRVLMDGDEHHRLCDLGPRMRGSIANYLLRRADR
jgi:hypothetical protein